VRLLRAMPAVTLAVASLLPAAACTSGGDGNPGETSAGKQVGVQAVGAGAAPQATLADQQSIIAAHKGEASYTGDVIPLKAELYAPLRSQGFIIIKVRLTNLVPAAEGRSKQWQIGSDLAGEDIGTLGTDTFSGVFLLDRKNSKQYLVARNTEKRFLASAHLSGVFLQPQQAVELFATFGAPPDDVPAVDVSVPLIPVFENVPLG
jgi:hypothetical protein